MRLRSIAPWLIGAMLLGGCGAKTLPATGDMLAGAHASLTTSLGNPRKLKSMSEAAYQLIKTRVNVQNYVDNIVHCVKATHAASQRQSNDDTPVVVDTGSDTSETLSSGEAIR